MPQQSDLNVSRVRPHLYLELSACLNVSGKEKLRFCINIPQGKIYNQGKDSTLRELRK